MEKGKHRKNGVPACLIPLFIPHDGISKLRLDEATRNGALRLIFNDPLTLNASKRVGKVGSRAIVGKLHIFTTRLARDNFPAARSGEDLSLKNFLSLANGRPRSSISVIWSAA